MPRYRFDTTSGALLPLDGARPHTRNGSTRKWRKARARILRRDGERCAYCGGHADQVDHVVPVFAGGSDKRENLVAACGRCNREKGAS
jgi:5-methylcytosine-specific restriction endonuclease McrA